MRIYRSLVAIVIAALAIVLSISLSSAVAAQAADGCGQTYMVQPGDWLYSIARRFNTPAAELIRLNPQLAYNPDRIYPGQVLCVSMATPRAVAIEAKYQYELNTDETEWNMTARGGYVGKRRVLTVPGLDDIEVYSLTQDVFTATRQIPSPVLLGLRNGLTATTYTLVFIGGADILSSIHISGTVTPNPRCFEPPTVQETLGLTDVNVLDVTVWLEGGSELRFPFSVTNIDAKPDWAHVRDCYVQDRTSAELIGFALFPAVSGKPDEYRVMIRLTQEGFGPPGSRWYNRCVSWSYGGWFNRWFRSWACPRF